jgi:uncharacterized phage-associated protein
MASPLSVANWFVQRLTNTEVGDVVTHLRVQKLLYFAQAWHLLALDRPLFDEDMQAWAHGPVVPSVFHALKEFGWQPLPLDGDADDIEGDSLGILEQVVDIYGDYSAKRLERMTHGEDPWRVTRGELSPEERCERPIPMGLIRDYYLRTYGELEDGEEAAQAGH